MSSSDERTTLLSHLLRPERPGFAASLSAIGDADPQTAWKRLAPPAWIDDPRRRFFIDELEGTADGREWVPLGLPLNARWDRAKYRRVRSRVGGHPPTTRAVVAFCSVPADIVACEELAMALAQRWAPGRPVPVEIAWGFESGDVLARRHSELEARIRSPEAPPDAGGLPEFERLLESAEQRRVLGLGYAITAIQETRICLVCPLE
jgi:hypothetical protein